jgi:uncharacterized protein
MHFEWDETKRRTNLEKHGIDFIDAAVVFEDGPKLVTQSSFSSERRFVAIAQLAGREIAVVFTVRGDAIRIISARRARDNERKAYRQAFGG